MLQHLGTVLTSVVSAAFGALGLWWANRVLGKAAFQTAINQGFEALTNQLQEERSQLLAEIENGRARGRAERAELASKIADLVHTVEGLKALLRAHGIDVPEEIEAMVLRHEARR
ncbi:MAG: hypothetical protein E6Q94_07770 [Burkholderiaceae bacterium]|nr:MAG: hypothetical protein E6Q94_07770 [Burkholderiaceae bacterium]